jgi:hypothetical protein
MDREHARRFVEAAISLDAGLGTIDAAISDLPDGEEREWLAGRLGAVLKLLNESFIRPMAMKFPELDPDARPT